jgi:hypothetical protein
VARLFDDASTEYLFVDTTAITSLPVTISCWARADVLAVDKAFVFIGDKDVEDNRIWLAMEAGDNLRAYSSGGVSAFSGQDLQLNRWHHCCGVWAAQSDRRVVLDGYSIGTDGTLSSSTPANWDRISIGVLGDSSISMYMSGSLAEVCIWRAILSYNEIAALARGVSPWRIRPSSVRCGYWPLRQNRTWDRDISDWGHHMTPYNSPTWDVHPPQAQKYWMDYDMRMWRQLATAPTLAAVLGERGVLRGVGRGLGRGL